MTSDQVKMVYIASLNDQVVPLYSGLFTAAEHPLILRALYIDGDVYQCVVRFLKGRFVPEIADATPARPAHLTFSRTFSFCSSG
jgi:hypothetical protein